jgi:hypothetical protein
VRRGSVLLLLPRFSLCFLAVVLSPLCFFFPGVAGLFVFVLLLGRGYFGFVCSRPSAFEVWFWPVTLLFCFGLGALFVSCLA